jgi:hypothetical protein
MTEKMHQFMPGLVLEPGSGCPTKRAAPGLPSDPLIRPCPAKSPAAPDADRGHN